MISITWVEMVLLGSFTGSIAFSIGFCLINYAKHSTLQMAAKAAK